MTAASYTESVDLHSITRPRLENAYKDILKFNESHFN